MEVKICFGRGGWSWYTGSSSWYYRCGIMFLLGLKVNKNILTFDPCIPDEWEEYLIRYKYNTSIYNIKLINCYKTNKVKEVKINGMIENTNEIKMIDNNKIYDVEIKI